VSGPDSVGKARRKQIALEIVMSSGVNSPKRFAETTIGTTFKEQARQFMERAMTRKRRPAKPATISSWQNCLDKWLNPELGERPLANVNNAAMKSIVAKMHAAGLSAKSIANYSGLVKLVVASAVDDNGEPLFPRKWNHDFIDMPVVENQRQPTFKVETINSIVSNAEGQERVLYALLAGSGIRIGEAMGLEVCKHISNDCGMLSVRQSVWEGDTQAPKTPSALREIDLCVVLATMLKAFIGDRKDGFLFRNRKGKPLSQTNLLRRSLHPILKELGADKAGFHAFRRFRATWLRKNRTPEDLTRFWLGHANRTTTDEYAKLSEDVEFRREMAERIGLGFELTQREEPIVRSVRRKEAEAVTEKQA